jgi:dipeptidyl aminopeptidase/acylaminoacyl peptidase
MVGGRYGGYLTALTLARAGKLFKAAVALYPPAQDHGR